MYENDEVLRKFKRKFPYFLNQYLDREHFESYQTLTEQLLTIEAEDKQVTGLEGRSPRRSGRQQPSTDEEEDTSSPSPSEEVEEESLPP